jgi:hypothetical protein
LGLGIVTEQSYTKYKKNFGNVNLFHKSFEFLNNVWKSPITIKTYCTSSTFSF